MVIFGSSITGGALGGYYFVKEFEDEPYFIPLSLTAGIIVGSLIGAAGGATCVVSFPLMYSSWKKRLSKGKIF